MLGKLLQINVFGRYEPKLSGGLQGETRRDCPLIMSGTKKGQTRSSYVTGNAWRDDMMGGKLKDMHACGEISAWHDTSRTAICSLFTRYHFHMRISSGHAGEAAQMESTSYDVAVLAYHVRLGRRLPDHNPC